MNDRRQFDPQVRFNRMRVWEALLMALLLIVLSVFVAAKADAAEPEAQPITVSCYYVRDYVSLNCRDMRAEAENYFGHSQFACARMFYIVLVGTTETVRCRSYEGGVIDYISKPDGSFQILR